jgi:hypothetical protein
MTVKSPDLVQELGAPLVGEDVGGSGRLELRHLSLISFFGRSSRSARTREIDSALR